MTRAAKVRRPCSCCGKLRWARARRRVPRWFATLRRGDVLKRSGRERHVLDVSRREDGTLTCVEFQKLRPSQYKSPTTVYTASDLMTFGFRFARSAA